MTTFASSAELPKAITKYFVEGKDYDTYKIPAGTTLFKSYRDTLENWKIDKVIPVKSPAYFGFDELNVSGNYGFAFAYKTTKEYELLAIDSNKTLEYLWGLAEHNENNEAIRKSLQLGFGYYPGYPNKPQIRTSNEKLDYILVNFLCEQGLHGYAGDYIRTDGNGKFHPECVMCGDTIHVVLDPEYSVAGKEGLASPLKKHVEIHTMLTNIKGPNKRKNNNDDYNGKKSKIEDEQIDEYKDISTNLFSDFDGGSRRKKRTHKRVIRRRRSKKNKSRK